jgi:protein-S-isoprenylcysteine O-methyltransferase Ste14
MANDSQPDDVVTFWQAQGTDGFRMSTEDIHKRIETMNRKLRRDAFDGYLVCALMIVIFIGSMFVRMSSLETLGAILSIIGYSYLAWQIRQNRFRGAATGDAGDTASLDHLRTELARQRDFHRGARLWWRLLLVVPGPLVFWAGFAQAHPEPLFTIRFEIISFVVVAIACIPVNRWWARRYQRQIDQLARLQEEH